MSRPKRRNRSLNFECLEKRETPSTLMVRPSPGPPSLAHANRHAFEASGTATLIGMPPDSGGGGGFTAAAKGRATWLGAFSGTMIVTTDQNGGASVELDIRGRHRSGLQIAMTVLGSDNSGPTTDFHGTFAITGGAGRLKRAIGGGSVDGTVNGQLQDLTFNLLGTSVS
jgi:hypothetical protein